MSSIVFVLLISIVIIIERAFRYWFQYDLPNSEGYMSAVQKMVMNNSIENAIRLCKKAKPKLLPYVLSEALKRANDSTQEIENAMEHAFLSVLPKATKGVAFLSTTANVATLLGLLGTIFGLMKSFGAAAFATGAQKQTILAEGIAEALTRNLVRTGHGTVVPASLRGVDDEADCNRQRHQQKLSPFARSFVYSQTKTEQLAI